MTSRLEIADSGATQSILLAPAKIDPLPQELLNQIFSTLNQHDLQTIVLVNRGMKNRVIAAASVNEPASIKKFIKLLIENKYRNISYAKEVAYRNFAKYNLSELCKITTFERIYFGCERPINQHNKNVG